MASKATATVSAVTLAAGLAGGYWLAPARLPGDANGDGIVNQADIDSVLANWLSYQPPIETPQIDMSGAKVYTNGDSNGGAGWQVNGPDNRVLIDMPGDTDDWPPELRCGVKFLSHTPDPAMPGGGEQP